MAEAARFLLVLDFEATCDNERKMKPQEVIELPVVVIDRATLGPPEKEAAREFHTYVRPTVHPQLSAFCTELTGIEQATVDGGVPFARAWSELAAWCRTHGYTAETALLCTCGDWDLRTMLTTQLRTSGLARTPLFTRWLNVKRLFDRVCAPRRARGMAGMLKDLGLPLVGRHHSGIDDARNIARVLATLLKRGGVPEEVLSFAKKDKRAPAKATATQAPGSSGQGRGGQQKKGGTAPLLPGEFFPLVDIGVNLTKKHFRRDMDDVLARAVNSGVGTLIITGTSVRASLDARAMCAANTSAAQLFFTAGVHPHDAKTWNDKSADQLRGLAAHTACVAMGEMGLDFHRNLSPPDVQLRVFEAQLQLAVALGKPVFLHSRGAKAHKPFCDLMARYAPQLPAWCVHCFTGSEAEMMDFVRMGAYIGLTGWLLDRRGAAMHAYVARIPMDKLMIETDAPYIVPRMSPDVPNTRRNEPALLPVVARCLSKLYGVRDEELAAATTRNARTFFALPQ